jgi:hypothetical protein
MELAPEAEEITTRTVSESPHVISEEGTELLKMLVCDHAPDVIKKRENRTSTEPYNFLNIIDSLVVCYKTKNKMLSKRKLSTYLSTSHC